MIKMIKNHKLNQIKKSIMMRKTTVITINVIGWSDPRLVKCYFGSAKKGISKDNNYVLFSY